MRRCAERRLSRKLDERGEVGVETKNVTTAQRQDHGVQHAERVVAVGMGRHQVVVQQASNKQACPEGTAGTSFALDNAKPEASDIRDVTRGPLGIERHTSSATTSSSDALLWIIARSCRKGLRHDAAAMEDHDVGAEPFDAIEQVRAVDVALPRAARTGIR